jgi:hypothetical protein
MTPTQTETEETCLLNMVGGFWTTQVIYSAVEIGLADALSQGPSNVQSLATRLNASRDAIEPIAKPGVAGRMSGGCHFKLCAHQHGRTSGERPPTVVEGLDCSDRPLFFQPLGKVA